MCVGIMRVFQVLGKISKERERERESKLSITFRCLRCVLKKKKDKKKVKKFKRFVTQSNEKWGKSIENSSTHWL